MLDGRALYFESLALPSHTFVSDDAFKVSVWVSFPWQAVICCIFSKSPSPNSILAEHLDYGGYPSVLFLTAVFNAMGHVQASFACGYVTNL